MTKDRRPLWGCSDCDITRRSYCVGASDWPDGILRGEGPNCPECGGVMDLLEDPADRKESEQ